MIENGIHAERNVARCRSHFIFCHFVFLALMALMWQIACPGQLAAQPPITALSFTPDGTQVVAGSQLGIQIYDVEQRGIGQIETDLEFISDIRFEKNGLKLAIVGGSPGESGSLELFRWPERKRVLQKRISDDVLYSVDWSPNGRLLAIAGHDSDWRLFDIEKNQVQKTWSEHSRPIRTIRYLADPNPLVSASFDQTIRVWQTDRTKAVRSLNNHTAEINAIAVSPIANQSNSKMLVSVGEDKTIRFWQPTIGRMVRFARIPSIPTCVEWDTQGRFAVVGCEDGKLYVIDSQTVAVELGGQLFDGPIFCIARHSNQNLFAVGGSKNRWTLITPEPFQNAQNR